MYRVLIVDDDHLVREGLKNSVSWADKGFDSIFFASNGREALTLYEKYSHDMIITDIKMPVMDGIELCGKIRKISGSAKIVVISGYSEFEYAQKAILYDVFAYLLKPIETDVINETLENVKRSLDLEARQKNENLIENIDEYITFLLSSMLDGTSDIQEIVHKLRKAGFFRDSSHYRIVALDYCTNAEADGDLTAINNKIKKISGEYGCFYLVRDLKYYILLSDNKAISDNSVMKLYKRLSEELNFLSVTGGAGSQFENIEELKLQARHSYNILKNKYYNGKGKLYLKEREPQGNNSKKSEFDVAQIIAGIKNNDKANTLLQLNRIFVYYKNKKEPEINKLCIELMQLYNKISEELANEYPLLNSLSAETIFENIYKCDSFNDVRNLFEGYIEGFREKIATFREFNNQLQLVDNIKNYIDRNYSDNLSLEELSKSFYISSSYISKLFKKECGQNIKDYIKSVRMAKAGDMLINSNKRVKIIAEELGYMGYRHFCTVFKNYYNVSPLQYRIVNNNAVNEKE